VVVDKLTKMLFAAIAIALWMIALNPWLRPMPVAAMQQMDLGDVELLLSIIQSNVSSIGSDISDIEDNVDDIEDGSCPNSKIC